MNKILVSFLILLLLALAAFGVSDQASDCKKKSNRSKKSKSVKPVVGYPHFDLSDPRERISLHLYCEANKDDHPQCKDLQSVPTQPRKNSGKN